MPPPARARSPPPPPPPSPSPPGEGEASEDEEDEESHEEAYAKSGKGKEKKKGNEGKGGDDESEDEEEDEGEDDKEQHKGNKHEPKVQFAFGTNFMSLLKDTPKVELYAIGIAALLGGVLLGGVCSYGCKKRAPATFENVKYNSKLRTTDDLEGPRVAEVTEVRTDRNIRM